MLMTAPKQFLLATAAVGGEILGSDHPLLHRIEAAEADPKPHAISEIQEDLAKLPEELRSRLLQAVHKYMRQDISAIWDHLSHAGDTRIH